MRRSAAAGLLVALLLPLAACGDPSDDYCRQLGDDNERIAEMIGSDSPTALMRGLPMLEELAEKSPEDLADEWQTFLGALDGLDDALDEAGVKASDFKDGKAPTGLSQADQKAIADAASQVSGADVAAAADGIEQQARDVCKVNLGLS